MTSDVDSDPAVRDRILEFLGGDMLDEARCEFITADDCSPDVRFVIPIDRLKERDGLRLMRDPQAVRGLAGRSCVRIPDQSGGTENLIATYARSSLARFHEWFYAAERDPPETWTNTYDRTPLDSLPPCVRIVLEEPNDRPLKPAGIQHVLRVLCAQGWHPRHIAGLICSFPAHLDYHNAQAVRVAADQIAGLGLEPYSLHAPVRRPSGSRRWQDRLAATVGTAFADGLQWGDDSGNRRQGNPGDNPRQWFRGDDGLGQCFRMIATGEILTPTIEIATRQNH